MVWTIIEVWKFFETKKYTLTLTKRLNKQYNMFFCGKTFVKITRIYWNTIKKSSSAIPDTYTKIHNTRAFRCKNTLFPKCPGGRASDPSCPPQPNLTHFRGPKNVKFFFKFIYFLRASLWWLGVLQVISVGVYIYTVGNQARSLRSSAAAAPVQVSVCVCRISLVCVVICADGLGVIRNRR